MPGAYRFARALAVNINTMDFVTVARVRGESLLYLIGSEILPNIIRPVLADLGVRFVFIVLLLSGLSFLGLGLPVATPKKSRPWGGFDFSACLSAWPYAAFSSSSFQLPLAARLFMAARWVKARWPAATFSCLPPHVLRAVS